MNHCFHVLPFFLTDVEKMAQFCKRRTCDGHYWEVSEVQRSTKVKVTGVPGSLTCQTLELYFENKRRSQGGEVESVDTHFEDEAFIVTFKNPEGK